MASRVRVGSSDSNTSVDEAGAKQAEGAGIVPEESARSGVQTLRGNTKRSIRRSMRKAENSSERAGKRQKKADSAGPVSRDIESRGSTARVIPDSDGARTRCARGIRGRKGSGARVGKRSVGQNAKQGRFAGPVWAPSNAQPRLFSLPVKLPRNAGAVGGATGLKRKPRQPLSAGGKHFPGNQDDRGVGHSGHYRLYLRQKTIRMIVVLMRQNVTVPPRESR